MSASPVALDYFTAYQSTLLSREYELKATCCSATACVTALEVPRLPASGQNCSFGVWLLLPAHLPVTQHYWHGRYAAPLPPPSQASPHHLLLRAGRLCAASYWRRRVARSITEQLRTSSPSQLTLPQQLVQEAHLAPDAIARDVRDKKQRMATQHRHLTSPQAPASMMPMSLRVRFETLSRLAPLRLRVSVYLLRALQV